MVRSKANRKINYFISGPNEETDRGVSAKITKQLQNNSKNRIFWRYIFIQSITKVFVIFTADIIQGIIRVTLEARHK